MDARGAWPLRWLYRVGDGKEGELDGDGCGLGTEEKRGEAAVQLGKRR